MDPTTLVDWLTTLGPYAVAGILAFWLKLERAERIAAQADANSQRDQRAAEMKESTGALAELGEATRKTLDELVRACGKERT
jgi:hypothetical protein